MNFTEASGILSVCVTEGLGTGLVGMPAQDVLIGEKIISMVLVSHSAQRLARLWSLHYSPGSSVATRFGCGRVVGNAGSDSAFNISYDLHSRPISSLPTIPRATGKRTSTTTEQRSQAAGQYGFL